jgi:nicotinate-nucleotide--dimethylbenzimidazole phosphoribosyltransferase
MKLLSLTLNEITESNSDYQKIAEELHGRLTKPAGSLGDLEEVGIKISKIQSKCPPEIISKPAVVVFAGDHGVLDESVTPWPKEVTMQMVYNFLNNTAAINVIANTVAADVFVVDAGVSQDLDNLGNNSKFLIKKIGYSTKNIVKEDAMDYDQAVASIEAGIEVAEELVDQRYDLLVTGDMGIGNTTPSAAVISCLSNTDPKFVTGRGTGIDDKMLEGKVRAIEAAIKRYKLSYDSNDPIQALCSLGGFEIGEIAGFILGAAKRKVPVILDGVISLAGALIAYELCSKITDYSFAGHLSVEPGAKIVLNILGLSPLLNLNMRLGEGTGGTLSIPIVKAAVNILNDMATFDSANVSTKD